MTRILHFPARLSPAEKVNQALAELRAVAAVWHAREQYRKALAAYNERRARR